MRIQRKVGAGEPPGFFRISFCHDSLANMYKMNFNLMQHHQYSLSELENMIPWEREVFIKMLADWIEKENERYKQQSLK